MDFEPPNVPAGEDGRVIFGLIRDLDHYVATHGVTDRPSDGALSERNFAVSQQRIADEREYQASIHDSIFADNVDKLEREKQIFLSSLENEAMDIQTSTELLQNVPVRPLAESCDTIYALVSSRDLYRGSSQEDRLFFSLKSFSSGVVKEFLSLVSKRKETEDVSNDCVVDCCQIAHYVQCNFVLDAMVDILVRSIDSQNCRSICELADQLNLSVLFEQSLSFMMESVGNIEDDEHVWDGLSSELKRRIETVKSAIQSSVHLQRNQLYFGTLNEYLAIFAENVEYHRERLHEAKIGLGDAGRGRAHDYAAAKIAKQEERVRTLEAVMKEQKKIFTGENDNGGPASIQINRVNRASKHARHE